MTPGGAAPGTLAVTGNLGLGAADTLSLDVMGTAPGTGHDQVAVSGTVNLGGATLAIDDTGFTDCCNAGQVSYYDLQ